MNNDDNNTENNNGNYNFSDEDYNYLLLHDESNDDNRLLSLAKNIFFMFKMAVNVLVEF